jgi:CYTH domain-containing protein
MPKYIEQKYLVEPGTPIEIYPMLRTDISLGFLAIEEGKREVYLRDMDGEYSQVTRIHDGATRKLFQIGLSADEYNELAPAAEDRWVEKTRFHVAHGENRTVELDIYRGALHGLLIARLKLPNADAANGFMQPAYFGDEITGDDRYKGWQLALHGIPTEPVTPQAR